ncbi:MAG: carboxypeptidase-like regulatory domain-containing protein, partial [Muribaculaceae bacterium]|nr:carboxypeptidase-like regulatory domain-containing protein [Muribaculaceae bacterium]
MKKSLLSVLLLVFLAIAAQAQNISVHGTVLSRTDDEPLIGASVISDATGTGVTTDLDGNFTISVPEGSGLSISYVGFVTANVTAENRHLTIYLDENSELLEELVVTGYTVQRKADLTGSVAAVSFTHLTLP